MASRSVSHFCRVHSCYRHKLTNRPHYCVCFRSCRIPAKTTSGIVPITTPTQNSNSKSSKHISRDGSPTSVVLSRRRVSETFVVSTKRWWLVHRLNRYWLLATDHQHQPHCNHKSAVVQDKLLLVFKHGIHYHGRLQCSNIATYTAVAISTAKASICLHGWGTQQGLWEMEVLPAGVQGHSPRRGSRETSPPEAETIGNWTYATATSGIKTTGLDLTTQIMGGYSR